MLFIEERASACVWKVFQFIVNFSIPILISTCCPIRRIHSYSSRYNYNSISNQHHHKRVIRNNNKKHSARWTYAWINIYQINISTYCQTIKLIWINFVVFLLRTEVAAAWSDDEYEFYVDDEGGKRPLFISIEMCSM